MYNALMVTRAKPSPCLDCPKRVPGCHAACEDYQAYSAKCERDRERKIYYELNPRKRKKR